MFKLVRRFTLLSLLILSCILPAAGQVQPCHQGTLANVLGTSCSVGPLILHFGTFFTGFSSISQQGNSTFTTLTPSDIGFIPVQVNGQAGYRLAVNWTAGPGADSTFVADQLLQFDYTPESAAGFEIRAVQSQIVATAQAPPQGTAITGILDFQTYSNTGFQATQAFFAIDPSFTFPPEHLTDHFILEVPSPLSTGSLFGSPTTQLNTFVLGTGSASLTSATLTFQMEPILPPPPQAALTYTNIDLQGMANTSVSNINNAGQIAGSYQDALGVGHGFVMDKQGGITTIDFPGAVSTSAFGINDRGDLVGVYTDVAGTTHGFLSAHGNLTSLDPPGSIFTIAFGINDKRQIVGEYDAGDGPLHGFLFENGTFTNIDQGEIPVSEGFTFTEAIGINNRGEIVGDFFDPNILRGFIGSNNVFQAFEIPSQSFTLLGGINDPGDYVGIYLDTQLAEHGFLNHQGNFQTVDFPGADSTLALGINASGTIVGTYRDDSGAFHSFLAQPGAKNGPEAQTRTSTLRHAVARPVCGSAEWKQQLARNGRVQVCKPKQ